jgi:hypothetical protein
MIDGKFGSGQHSDGAFFIDRDPALFRIVLDLYRDNTVYPLPPGVTLERLTAELRWSPAAPRRAAPRRARPAPRPPRTCPLTAPPRGGAGSAWTRSRPRSAPRPPPLVLIGHAASLTPY